MTVREFADALSLTRLTTGDENLIVEGGYCGDLLSWVMGRAPAGSAWITIMTNRNTLAVALLTEVHAIVFAEGVLPDEEVLEKAREEGLNLLASEKSTFELAGELYRLLEKGI